LYPKAAFFQNGSIFADGREIERHDIGETSLLKVPCQSLMHLFPAAFSSEFADKASSHLQVPCQIGCQNRLVLLVNPVENSVGENHIRRFVQGKLKCVCRLEGQLRMKLLC